MVSALLSCLVIVGLFVGTYLVPGPFWLNAAVFVLALVVLIAPCYCFSVKSTSPLRSCVSTSFDAYHGRGQSSAL